MEEINPFLAQPSATYNIPNNINIPNSNVNIPILDNPFNKLVKKNDELPDINQVLNKYGSSIDTFNKNVSTYNVQDYLKRGYKLTDLDLSETLDNQLSSTQSRTDRLLNNLKVAGANLISMGISTFTTLPTDLNPFNAESVIENENSIDKKLFNWSNTIREENRNFETLNDTSDDLWENITNWIYPLKNSTKGIGNILESVAYGVGAGIGIAGQEAIVTLLTGGTGTIPLLSSKIQQLLNSSNYLQKALKVSRVAEEGANSLSKIVTVGEISDKISKTLLNTYRSQLGSYSEALFEGFEGKESLRKQLIDDFEKTYGYTPEGKDLEKIEADSTEVGAKRMNINRALLSFTNFSQFNSIFKSFDAIKEGAELYAEKYGSNIIYENGKAIVTDKTKRIKSDWFNNNKVGKVLKPVVESAINLKSGDVIKESLQEGLEEGSQFFIDKALNNYYTWKHYGENKTVSNALEKSLGELFSKEGLESIFTGILAGGGQTAFTNFVSSLSPDYKASKEQYKLLQESNANTYNDLKEKIKSIPEEYKTLPLNIKKKLDVLINNDSVRGTITDKIQQANASSEILKIKNSPIDEEQFNQAMTHEMFNIAIPYAKNGDVSILTQQFNEFKELNNEEFGKLFSLTEEESKRKDDIVNEYISEFKKIENVFKKVNSAFVKPKDLNVSTFNTLKNELAFSYYNNDRLIKTAKELELGINKEYFNEINDIISSPKDSIKNINSEIKKLQDLDNIKTKDDEIKLEGLEKMKEFLENLSEDTTKSEFKKALFNNIILPYEKNNITSEQFDLEDKLNKIYYLNKIRDRISENQKKLNAILFQDNPQEYIQKLEIDFIKELIKRKTEETKNENDIPVSETTSNQEESLTLPPPLIIDENPILEKPKINLEEQTSVIEEKDNLEEYNNIESKDQELVYIVNKEGKIVGIDSEEAKFRATKLAKVINQYENINYFKNKLEFNYWKNPEEQSVVKFPIEKHLYKKSPKEGINITYKGNSMGIIPLERELYIDLNEFNKISELNIDTDEFLTYKNKELRVISYTNFLEILNLDKEIENKVRKKGFIINSRSPSISDLINNHKKYVNFSNSVYKNNIIQEKFIKNQIDILAFIDSKKKQNNLIPLLDLIGKDKKPPIIKTTFIDGEYLHMALNRDIVVSDKFKNQFKFYNSEQWKEGESRLFTYLINHNDKWTDDTIHIISASQRPISAYTKELENIYKSDVNILQFLQNNLAFKSNLEDEIISFESNSKGNQLQINIEKDGNTSKRYIDYSLLINKSLKDILNVIKSEIENDNRKVEIYKSARTIENSYSDYDSILVNNYFNNNNFQIYSTLMLKITPNEFKEGEVIKKVENNVLLNENKKISLENKVYFKRPSLNGEFENTVDYLESNKPLYVADKISDEEYEIYIDDTIDYFSLLKFPDSLLSPVANFSNFQKENHDKIKTLEKGIVKLNSDGKWKITKKINIEFYNSKESDNKKSSNTNGEYFSKIENDLKTIGYKLKPNILEKLKNNDEKTIERINKMMYKNDNFILNSIIDSRNVVLKFIDKIETAKTRINKQQIIKLISNCI